MTPHAKPLQDFTPDRPLSDPSTIEGIEKLSYAKGPTDVPLLEETLGQNLARIVAKYPENEAIVDLHGDIHMTYQEFHRKVQRLASGLHAAGLPQG